MNNVIKKMISLKNIHDSTNTCIHEKYCRLMQYYCVLAKKSLRYSSFKSCVPECKFYEWLNGVQRHSYYLDQGYGCE